MAGKVDRIILTGGSRLTSSQISMRALGVGIAPAEMMPEEEALKWLEFKSRRETDPQKLAAAAVDRIRICKGVEPYTTPAKYCVDLNTKPPPMRHVSKYLGHVSMRDGGFRLLTVCNISCTILVYVAVAQLVEHFLGKNYVW